MKILGKSLLLISLAAGLAAPAANLPALPAVSSIDMARSDNNGVESLYVSYTIDRTGWKLPTNMEMIITPVVMYEDGSVDLTPVILAGRAAYLSHKRNDDLKKSELPNLFRDKGGDIQRNERVAWQPGMVNSQLIFRSELRGCRCATKLNETLPDTFTAYFGPKVFDVIIPRRQLAAMEMKVEEIVKTRELSKSAYVNYKVGSSQLLPDYKSNPVELAAIVATIDSVRNDKDLTVNLVNIHGYASPDGPYDLNAKLAAGRTAALREYVDKHYGFGKKLKAESTPEDWAGLRKWVASSVLANKGEILAIIDSSEAPDVKEKTLQSRFPADYAILLEQVFPSLRRSDYKIEYTVRTFTDPSTIAGLMKTDPGKLSMEEIMLLARTYKEGSEEREDLVLTSAELFPTDARAQLNGAFVALSRGNYDQARRLLARSDNSPLADYGRGLLALNSQDYTTAQPLLERAKAAGVEGADQALEFLSRRK